MQQPPPLPQTGQTIRLRVNPSPPWVRLLAGSADAIVAGLLAFAIIRVVLIPYFYPETQIIIEEYVDNSSNNFSENTALARTLMENESLKNMVVASQTILYSVFFLYFLLSEWLLKGSSLGKMIFRITVVRRIPGQALPFTTIFMRAWLKTVFLLLIAPILWVSFFWVFFQKEKRTLHDLITGTWVID
jgi:uncharacterized RDD family membrane protein YckC